MRFNQAPNSSKTNYFSHGSMWVPQDIAAGDIIEMKNGKKLGLILGFIYDTEQLAIRSVHVANITRDNEAARSLTALFIPATASRHGDVSGITLPAHIITDRTSWYKLEDVSKESFRIERVGCASPTYFERVLAALQKNNKASLLEIKDSRIYIPSLEYAMASQKVDAPTGLVPYGQLDDYDRALLIRDLKDPTRTMDGDEVHSAYVADLKQRQRAGYIGYLKNRALEREAAKLDATFRRANSTVIKPSASVVLCEPANTSFVQEDIIVPDTRQIIRTDTEVAGETPEMENLQAAFKRRAPVKTITLPKHLWQGRYLMLNISDLLRDGEGAEEDGTAYRPCAVWKAYADKNTGDIVGLELHPVTRNQAKDFKFKLPVYPLKTVSQKDSCLIADCVIRVPLSSEYFHEIAVSNFFELTPEKIEKFMAKKAAMVAMDVTPHVVGLQTIPDHWEEVELDPTPSMQQLQKWASTGHIRFDGNLTDKIRARTSERTRERARHHAPA